MMARSFQTNAVTIENCSGDLQRRSLSHSSALTREFVLALCRGLNAEEGGKLRLSAILGLTLIGCCLAACSSADKPATAVVPGSENSADAGAPVALAPRRGATQSIAMAVNQDELTKAIERLRITKKKADGPYDQAGADLNSDGRAKALVLLTGQDWCSPQGCTLVVMQPSDVGFRPISQIVGVKAPVAVGPGSNAGWRDLIVKTGTNKIVRLQFTGGGYPANASAQPDGAADVAQSEVLIQPPGSQTAAAAPAPGSPPPQ
jgi:hypothetical protein